MKAKPRPFYALAERKGGYLHDGEQLASLKVEPQIPHIVHCFDGDQFKRNLALVAIGHAGGRLALTCHITGHLFDPDTGRSWGGDQIWAVPFSGGKVKPANNPPRGYTFRRRSKGTAA